MISAGRRTCNRVVSTGGEPWPQEPCKLEIPRAQKLKAGALKNAKVPKRLINTGGFEKKDRIIHCIEISKPEDFDSGAKRWMKVAYDGDA